MGVCALSDCADPSFLLGPLHNSVGDSQDQCSNPLVLLQWAPAGACFGQSVLLHPVFSQLFIGVVLPSPWNAVLSLLIP